MVNAALLLAVALTMGHPLVAGMPSQAKSPPKPQTVDMGFYRVSAPPGEGWEVIPVKEGGSVSFGKRWGGALRQFADQQMFIGITVTLRKIPAGEWLLAEEDLAALTADKCQDKLGHFGIEGQRETGIRGGRQLYYLRFEERMAVSAFGLNILGEDPETDITSIYCYFFPPDFAKTHRFFEFTLLLARSSTYLGQTESKIKFLHAVVDSLEVADPFGAPPGPTGDLVRAAAAGDGAAAIRAIEAGADVNAELTEGTPLAAAAFFGCVGILDLILQKGGEIDKAGGGTGGTPLLWALRGQEPDAAAFLIAMEADVNAVMADGLSSLMLASALGYAELVPALLARGAELEAVSEWGETPLMFGCQSGSSETVDILLEAGADVNAKTPNGRTVLLQAIDSGNAGAARKLLERGAKANVWNYAEWPALAGAIWLGDAGLVDLLIEKGAEVNAPWGGKAETALLEALWAEEYAIAEALLAAGADVNTTRPGEWTPLMVATDKAQTGLVRLLIEKGADVNYRSGDGKTALKLAKKAKQTQIVTMLTSAGAK